MRARFDSELKARVVQMIMKFWGIETQQIGHVLICREVTREGFDFFARLYDAS